ncbi:MAG: type IV secretion system DNA-binding domain-containing protein [Candidatus Pacebacteria bacterium]|nr:type IV secretion system DNA-binding domain-containing protein [Candidatus Paceibacterota bacterium]NUQ56928.1 type IV secretion system DNA-binding domain-containing protein [Candidatus Paceibacter sp.]
MAETVNNNITYFGETNFRNERKKFGIKRRDRSRHMYIIGKTGVGKTTLLENMAIQDIVAGEGVGIVDPHGDFAEKMLKFIPKERVEDVLYFAPHDLDWPIAFNVMENVDPTQRHLVANGLLGVFKKIWPDVWSPRMEYILNNCILALLEYPDSTLLGINRMLSDKKYRDEVISKITDPVVKAFWIDEFSKYSERFMTEAGAAIQNKVGQFISNPIIRNIVGQPKSSFDLREIMDQKKILLMNLSKGRIGEENSRLIGAMLITKIYLAAMSRVDVPEKDRQDFNLFVDEFQNFANESFKDILSEARKYRLNLILAHQYIAQMDDSVRDAVVGNVGTLITFRVGAYDAEVLEKEFAPEFDVQDIVSLGFGSIYLKLMIDGMASRPFSAATLPPIQVKVEPREEEIIESSRAKYASSRQEVEEKIAEWHAQLAEELKAEKTAPQVRRSIPHPSAGREAKPQVYEAHCSVCGKKTYVPFQPDGKRAIYCKTHRPAPQSQQAPRAKERFPAFGGGGEIRTLGSGFKKRQDVEAAMSLNDLEKRKKAEPKLDELKKIIDEAIGDKKEDEPEEKDPGISLAGLGGGGSSHQDDYEEGYYEEDNEEVAGPSEERADEEHGKKNEAAVNIGTKGNNESENKGKNGEKILKPGDKIKFG